MKKLLLLGLALTLAACGARNDLRPPEGQSLPPTPYGASAPPTAAELIEPDPQMRPERNDELLTESKEREDDPFDLPPPG